MLMNDNEYLDLVQNIKQEIQHAQYKAALSVNKELIALYYNIGQMINAHKTWGSKFIENLAADIKLSFPNAKGYSVRNLKYMAKFAATYPDAEFVQQAVAQIPWSHNVAILKSPCFVTKAPDGTQKNTIWGLKYPHFQNCAIGEIRISSRLGFFHELFLAFWARDTDFALAAGDADSLAAAGAVEIAVITILELVEKAQKTAIFLVALIGIAREDAQDRDDHQRVRNAYDHRPRGRRIDKRCNEREHERHAEHHHAELICSVAPRGKATQRGGAPRTELPQPFAKSIHKKTT